MEEEKKETGTQHFKLWLFAVIITMIFVLGRITAHADELSVDVGSIETDCSYWCTVQDGNTFITYMSNKPLVLRNYTNDNGYKCFGFGVRDGAVLEVYESKNGTSWALSYSRDVSQTAKNPTIMDFVGSPPVNWLGNQNAISNHDIYNIVDGTVFFSQMLTRPMAEMSVLERILGQTVTVILPTAVSCLALLVGLVILPTKLRIFLR